MNLQRPFLIFYEIVKDAIPSLVQVVDAELLLEFYVIASEVAGRKFEVVILSHVQWLVNIANVMHQEAQCH